MVAYWNSCYCFIYVSNCWGRSSIPRLRLEANTIFHLGKAGPECRIVPIRKQESDVESNFITSLARRKSSVSSVETKRDMGDVVTWSSSVRYSIGSSSSQIWCFPVGRLGYSPNDNIALHYIQCIACVDCCHYFVSPHWTVTDELWCLEPHLTAALHFI
jgi:hypothetical protein